MKISYNPKSEAAITASTASEHDIVFDLKDKKVWAKGIRMGADWSEISNRPSAIKNPNSISFKNINGATVSYDGSSAINLTEGVYKARMPYGFNSYADSANWGNTTGNTIASWNDTSGGSIDFRKDNPSSGKLSIKVDGRVYVNEGNNPVLSSEYGSGFWGMRTPDGGDDWIRTPKNGLIPYVSGNAGSGHSSLGTSGWYFSTAYIDKVYGNLQGNASTATTASKADRLTTARNIALGTDLRGSANFDGSGNITINATINSCTVNVGSTNGLPFKRIAHFETGNSWNDNALLLYISLGYINGNTGICRIEFRTDNISKDSTSATASAAVRWLVRNGFGLDSLWAGYYVTTSKAYIDIYLKTTGGYLGTVIRVLLDSRGGINSNVLLINASYSDANNHKEAYNSIEAAATTLYNKAYTKIVSGSDIGLVNYANSAGSANSTTKLQTSRKLWGNSFDGTADVNGNIVFPGIGDTAVSNKITWDGSTDGADIYYLTTTADQGNLVLNVRDDANAYIRLALNGSFKSYFDVLNSDWSGRSQTADRWTWGRTITIGNKGKTVDGSGNVSWTLAEIGAATAGHTHPWNSLTHSSTTANQAILTNGTANGWKLQTLNIANWDTAYNWVHSVAGSNTDGIINKWDEIVNFLKNINNDDGNHTLNTLLNSKLSILLMGAGYNLTTATNNALYWVDTNSNAKQITTGPFTNNPYALLSVTNCNLNKENSRFFYRSRLAFDSWGDIKVAACHYENLYKLDDTWYDVLTSKNSSISGSTIKINNSSITVYSSSTADSRYVKKSGDTMTGALNFANGTWNIVGDDVAIGDCNLAGCLGIKGLNGNVGLKFFNSSNNVLGLLYHNGSMLESTMGFKSSTSGFGSLIVQRNNDNDGASILFRGNSNIYGYIGFNAANKDKLLLRWSSDTSKMFTILDTSSTSILNSTVTINGTSIDVAKSNHNHDDRYVRKWYGEYGSYNKFLHASISDEKGWIRLEVSDSDNGLTGGYGIYMIGWTWHQQEANLIVQCLYSNYSNYVDALHIVRTDRNEYDFYFKFANTSAYPSYTINYAKSINSLNYTVTAVTAIPEGSIKSGLVGLLLSASYASKAGDADTVDGYHATSGRTFTGNINWSANWNDLWSDGTNKHPWYGFDHRYPSTGVYSTTLSDYFGLTLKTCSGNISITNSGLVGIGTYDPKFKLHVDGLVASKGFRHTAVTSNANKYVLTADGGYTLLNEISNEGVHTFTRDITVTDTWKDIDGFYGGNLGFLVTAGTYIVLCYYKTNSANAMWEGYFSGIMSWYTGGTNSNNTDEIVLHRAGHAYANTIYLRTRESPNNEDKPYTKLQISANKTLALNTYTFKFKRIC